MGVIIDIVTNAVDIVIGIIVAVVVGIGTRVLASVYLIYGIIILVFLGNVSENTPLAATKLTNRESGPRRYQLYEINALTGIFHSAL